MYNPLKDVVPVSDWGVFCDSAPVYGGKKKRIKIFVHGLGISATTF